MGIQYLKQRLSEERLFNSQKKEFRAKGTLFRKKFYVL